MLLLCDIAIANVKQPLYYMENCESVRSDEHIVHVKSMFLVHYQMSELLRLWYLSDDVAPGSDITPCINIDKPLVVYIFSGVL